MSYYKGGRGGSGSSFRGSSYRGSRSDSSWRGSRGSGGGFSSSRNSSSGRYFDSPQSSYDRPKSSYSGTDERYSGRSSRSGDDYRYSQSSQDYTPRDFGRSSSPEVSRKRLRGSSPTYVAPRRSHERSFGGDYSPRGSSFYDKGSSGGGGYLSEKGSYREVRESRTTGGSGSDYAFRKPSTRGYSPRGSYRGRSRGVRRGFRSGASSASFLRKKSSDSYAIRKGRSTRTEYLRRLRQYRMRRSSGLKDKNESDDEQDDDDDDDDDDPIEDDTERQEDEDEDSKDDVKSDTAKEGGSNLDDEKHEIKIKEESGDTKSENDKDEEMEKTPVKEKTASVVKKKINKTKKKETNVDKDDKDEDLNDSKEKDGAAMVSRIKLKCPHCAFLGTSFWEYSKHLSSKKHSSAMQTLSAKLRGKLTKMRIDQREKQKSLDEECKAKNMRLKTFFCSICKLNYRTLKSSHQSSLSHKKMKEFTLPYCRVCRLQFKSPFSYESHLGELMHLKRKARMDRLSRDVTEDVNDLDTSSFMVLDAVGSGDESVSEKTEDEEATNEGEADKDGESPSKKKKKDEIKLGSEHCKLVEVYYCYLCKIYLPRSEDQEKSLAIHCRSRTHLERYIRHRDAKALRKRAVKLHKEHEKEKEILKSQTKEGDEENQEASKTEKVGEDKAWSEVDKDLSDLLQDNEENKDEDDEDIQQRERYDRFKLSHKNDKQAADTNVVSNGSLIETKDEAKEAEN